MFGAFKAAAASQFSSLVVEEASRAARAVTSLNFGVQVAGGRRRALVGSEQEMCDITEVWLRPEGLKHPRRPRPHPCQLPEYLGAGRWRLSGGQMNQLEQFAGWNLLSFLRA